ncbi:hypothetical protein Hypma_012990 [Hypsizygus marmoreus]|uniref:F-box domain-containing protein n=1 Tax=Hypsizygus marmoreus TaxID=39966 RepID=A0A369JHB8_HYPMA|nr:hypothetical protein Hypma_012990 [Hypsizygus marmoreus]
MPRQSIRDAGCTAAPIEPGETNEGADKQKNKKRRLGTSTTTSVQNARPNSKRQIRGRRGALKQLLELPLDLLFEARDTANGRWSEGFTCSQIFGHLNPADILVLSRTSKDLRNVLMRKSAAFVWKLARANVGLPDCPPDLNEPQFAKLLFDSLCDVRRLFANVWMRYLTLINCSSTARKQTRRLSFGRAAPEPVNSASRILAGSSVSVIHRKILFDTCLMNKDSAIPTHIGLSHRFDYGYCYRSASQLDKHYKTLDAEEKMQWVEEKLDEKRSISEHTNLCEAWFQAQAKQRVAELENMRQRRLKAIKAKLIDIDERIRVYQKCMHFFLLSYEGWGDELRKMSNKHLMAHKMVKQPKNLTDRSKSLHDAPPLGKIESSFSLEKYRTRDDSIYAASQLERLALDYRLLQQIRRDVFRNVYYGFLASQPVDAILPSSADVAILPEFLAIVNSPAEVSVAAGSFASAVQKLPQLLGGWRRFVDAKLVALINENGVWPLATESSLSLPTTFFGCKLCGNSVGYPHVIVHRCTTVVEFSPLHEDNKFSDLFCQPWNATNILFLENWIYAAGDTFLRQRGLDPSTATNDVLNDSTFFIECFDCPDEQTPERAVMTWHTAAHHIHAGKDPHMRQVKLDERDQEAVSAIISKRDREFRASPDYRCFICLTCRRKLDWTSLRVHIGQKHRSGDFTALVESVDYVFDMDYYFMLRKDVFRLTNRPSGAADPAQLQPYEEE